MDEPVGKVKAKVEVLRSGEVVQTLRFGKRRVRKNGFGVWEAVRFSDCKMSRALEEGDEIKTSFKFFGLPQLELEDRRSVVDIAVEVESIFESESSISVRGGPIPGSEIPNSARVSISADVSCDQPEGCSVDAFWVDDAGITLWGGMGTYAREGQSVVQLRVGGCRPGEKAAGIRLQLLRRNDTLLDEAVHAAEIRCKS